MINTFIRVSILYILVLIIMRLMGKREIGQMQPFELVIAIMIADLASIPMSDVGIPITNGIIPILALLLFQLVISIINVKSVKLREVICGKPSILIYRGKIDEKELRKEKITINELEERLRQNDIFAIGDVEYAILETNGQLSVIQKPEKRNTIPEDFNIVPEYEGIPYDLVLDGKIMYDNLKKIGRDYNWLKKEIQKFNMNPEEALVVTFDGKGQIFCQRKEKRKKMREVVIIVLILLLIVTGDIMVQWHLEKTSTNMASKLENLKETVVKAKESEKNEEAKEVLEEVEREWEKVNKTWSVIVIHEELDNIEQALVKAKSSINEGELEDRIRRNRNCNVFCKACKRKRKGINKKYFLGERIVLQYKRKSFFPFICEESAVE